MVLRSAQYMRHSNDDEAIVAEESDAANFQLPNSQGRSGSVVNANSISMTETGASDDTLSTGSDRLCAAPEGHVRFVNSTIRYHMNGPGFWQSKSKLEAGLIVAVITLTGISLTLMFVVIGMTNKVTDLSLKVSTTAAEHEPQYCLSPECVKVAGSILSDLDHDADPCDDFYQYACGGFEKLNPIPDGHSNWSMFEKLWEQNQLAMKNALEALAVSVSVALDNAEDKARLYYDSCIDKDGIIEELAGAPLLDLIRNNVGSWSLLRKPSDANLDEDFDESTFQMRVEIFHNHLQSSGLFSWSVGENDKNSSQHVIHVDQGGLTLPTRDYYNDTKVMDALKDVMKATVKLLIRDNANLTNEKLVVDKQWDAVIEQRVKEVIKFEQRIANFTVPAANRGEEMALYHKIKLSDLNRAADFINWTAYFANAFVKVDQPIDGDTEVEVHASLYLSNMSMLIKEHMNTTEGRRTLNSYLTWQLVKTMRNSLSKDYRDATKVLEKALLGRETRQERWRFCVSDTDSALGFAVGAMFIREAFNGKSKSVAQDMIDRVKMAFEKRLELLKWMDDATRKEAIKKAKAITDMIGYPEYILDEDKAVLNKKYAGLRVDKATYFDNVLRHHAFTLETEMRKLMKPVNRTKWGMTPPAVNAYYTPTKNQIVFPAGILQSPFFNMEYPASLNYGAMGVVMGHELSHAFDNQGREYDEVGNLREWWNNATLVKFKNKTGCFVDQYSRYAILKSGGWKVKPSTEVKSGEDVEATVRGKQTLGENIADNGGLKAAFYAYKQLMHEHERRKIHDQRNLPLPGLQHLTNDQLFFISFSQVWCSKYTPEASKLQTLEDAHSPAKFRVIGVLSNSKEFSSAFNCPLDSPMNPPTKCEVW